MPDTTGQGERRPRRTGAGGLRRSLYAWLDARLLALIQGYAYLKSMASGLSSEQQEILRPVLARFDDQSQIAFEVERTRDGKVIIFVPGAPEANSGSVAIVTPDRIEPLDAKFAELVKTLKLLGQGSAALLDRQSS